MFQNFGKLDEVTKLLHPEYISQVERADRNYGPLLSVLKIDAYFKAKLITSPSPVGAHLADLTFYTWSNFKKHFRKVSRSFRKAIDKNSYTVWSNKIFNLVDNEYKLLAYTVPLFAENQINYMSNNPSPAQDVFLNLLSPIISSEANIVLEKENNVNVSKPNASIYAFLFGGKSLFTLTCHGWSTITNWSSRLESATSILLPQVILEVEQNLP